MCNCSSAAEGRVYIHRWTEFQKRAVLDPLLCTGGNTAFTEPAHHTVRIQWNMTDNSTLYHNRLWRWCFRGFLAGFIYEHSAAAVFPWWQKTYTPLSFLQFCMYSAVIMPSETVNTRTLRAPGLLGSFLHDEQNKNEIQLQFNASSAVSSVR